MVLGRQMWWSTTDTLVILPPFILLATPTTHTHTCMNALFLLKCLPLLHVIQGSTALPSVETTVCLI